MDKFRVGRNSKIVLQIQRDVWDIREMNPNWDSESLFQYNAISNRVNTQLVINKNKIPLLNTA